MSGNMISTSLSFFRHSMATFCEEAWSAIKTVLRPNPMSFLAVMASFPFFLFGYDVAMLDLSSPIQNDLDLSSDELNLCLSLAGRVSYCLGAIVAGLATNYCGRRYLLAAGGAVYTLGALLVALTPVYATLVVGRVLTGFGVGMGLLLGPIYIAETAPSTTRGYHGAFPQVLMVLGTMTAKVLELATFSVPSHLAWRVIAGVVTLPTAVFTYTIVSRRFFDTPCWMMMCGQVRAAEDLMELCGATGAEPWDRRENLELVAGFQYGSIVDPRRVDLFPGRITGFWEDVTDRLGSYSRDLFTTGVLYVAQEAVCEQMIPWLLYVFLSRQGMRSQPSFAITALVLACVRLTATSISTLAAGRSMARRRGLLLVGVGVVVCSLGFLSGTTFADVHEHVDPETTFALSCVGALVLQAAIGVGLGPIPWMYGPEVFPLAVRAPSLAFCLLCRFISILLLGWTFPRLYFIFDRVWLGFLIAAGITLVFFLVLYRYVRTTTCRLLMDYPD